MRCQRVFVAMSAISCGGAALLAVSSALAETGFGPAPQQRILHTIPEDGQAADDVAPDEMVRALMASRPREDLVICLGGCSGRDRVVYAQPSRAAPEPPVAAAPEEQQGSMVPTAAPATDEPAAAPEPAHDPQEATPAGGSMSSTAPDGASLPSLPEASPAAE